MDVDSLLQELHIASIELLLERVKSGEATASELSVARQLLKDNNIEIPYPQRVLHTRAV